MDELQELREIRDEFSTSLIKFIEKHNLNLNVVYSLLLGYGCSIYKTCNSDIQNLLKDIENIYASLPPPIEDIDDNTNQ